MTGIMFARVHARAVCAFARTSTYAKSMLGRALPCLLALVLAGSMAPASAFAEGERSGAQGSEGEFGSGVPASPQPPSDPSTEAADSDITPSGGSEAAVPSVALRGAAEGGEVEGSDGKPLTLASGLVGAPSNFINSDVVLDSEPIIGSFTVDGLTYAVIDDSHVELVGVAPTAILGEAAEGGAVEGSDENHASEAGVTNLTLPETVAYEGADHTLASIAAYAFYLSGVTDVALPATVVSVDDRAFRSSDVAYAAVDPSNDAYSSYDGVLYDASLARLLLIPEGRSEGVRIPYTAEEVAPGAFSHVSSVAAISVDADSPTFSSEDGLLYDAAGATLLRVPAGAVEVTIREGCTAIAAGALEACAKLERINAPASVTSVSPDVLTSIPVVSLPAASALRDEAADAPMLDSQDGASSGVSSSLLDQANDPADSPEAGEAEGIVGSEGTTSPRPPSASPVEASIAAGAQLTAFVALSSADADLPEVELAGITVNLPEEADASLWEVLGFMIGVPSASEASLVEGAAYSAGNVQSGTVYLMIQNPYWAGGFPLVGNASYLNLSWTPSTSPIASASSITLTVSGLNRAKVAGSYTNDEFVRCWAIDKPSGGSIGTWRTPSGKTLTLRQLLSGSFTLTFPSSDLVLYSPGGFNSTFQDGHASIAISLRGVPVAASGTAVSSFDPAGGSWADGSAPRTVGNVAGNAVCWPARDPSRIGYTFDGWWTAAEGGQRLTLDTPAATRTYYAHWKPYTIDFDVDSEPGDADYPGDAKEPATGDDILDDGTIPIEDPKRPGYVFQGWTIPNAEGAEAIDQDLVYQDETDGKWYVDASKLPDYAGDDGRVELTARWTSVISVDVPSSVTFYADVVTQGNESREGLASSAFGQSKVASQSEVDLRIVGLESKQVKGNGSTSLGASNILKKKDGSDLPATSDKLFSLYPATDELTEDDLKDPDATSASKPEGAVDFSLDDILLERSFAADEFTIPAGGTLSLGYRLNLQETSTELDYDKLSTLSEGASASIANISYCFAADYGPVFWTADDDGSTLELASIKADAEKIAAGDASTISKYTAWMNADHRFYVKWYDQGVAEADNPTKATVYDVRIIGLNHDDKSDGSGKAGITFQFANLPMATYRMNATRSSKGGWGASELRARMNPGVGSGVDGVDDNVIWNQMPISLHNALLPVEKNYWNGGSLSGAAIASSSDHMFLLSYYEITSTSRSGRDTCLAGEGSTYDFFIGTNGSTSNVSNPRLVIRTLDGTAAQWIQRSPCTFGEDYPDGEFWIVNSKGGAHWNSMTADNANAVRIAPAFCL